VDGQRETPVPMQTAHLPRSHRSQSVTGKKLIWTSLRQDRRRRDVSLWIFRPVDKIAWKCERVRFRCGERVFLRFGILS
jgi:hypothetical protein